MTDTKIEDRSISNLFLKERHISQIIPRSNFFLVDENNEHSPDSNMAENADVNLYLQLKISSIQLHIFLI